MRGLILMISLSKILIAIDGSEHSDNAIRYGIFLAKQNNSMLIGLHVIDEKVFSAYKLMKKDVNELKQELYEKGRYILSQFEKLAISNDIPNQSVIEEGITYQVIIDYAEKQNVNLIIMGHESESRPLSSKHVGSNARNIIEFMKCPVLIIN